MLSCTNGNNFNILSVYWRPVVFSGLRNEETRPVRILWTRVTSWLQPAALTTARCPATPPLTTPCPWPTAVCKCYVHQNTLLLHSPLARTPGLTFFINPPFGLKKKRFQQTSICAKNEVQRQLRQLLWQCNSCTVIRERLARNRNWKDLGGLLESSVSRRYGK